MSADCARCSESLGPSADPAQFRVLCPVCFVEEATAEGWGPAMSAVERGTRLRARLTDRTYRVGRSDDEQTIVFAPPEGDCQCFAVPTSELLEDIDADRIEVVDA